MEKNAKTKIETVNYSKQTTKNRYLASRIKPKGSFVTEPLLDSSESECTLEIISKDVILLEDNLEDRSGVEIKLESENISESHGGSSDNSVQIFSGNDSDDEEILTHKDIENDVNFSQKLSAWAVDGNVCHSNVNKLLEILREHSCFKLLPIDARTLLCTPRQYNITAVPPGSYYHFGIEDGITSTLEKFPLELSSVRPTLNLHVNIDGLPLTKSSCSQFWPILGSLRNVPSAPPFLIGCYHGYSKSESANMFLSDFVADINSCLSDGVILK